MESMAVFPLGGWIGHNQSIITRLKSQRVMLGFKHSKEEFDPGSE
jgi:hypothetical protein